MDSAIKIAVKIWLNINHCRPSPFLKFLLEENFFNLIWVGFLGIRVRGE